LNLAFRQGPDFRIKLLSVHVSVLVFRFTKFWEKNIVIIREKWSVGIMINKEWLEPRLA
jgi:hypothetical protein